MLDSGRDGARQIEREMETETETEKRQRLVADVLYLELSEREQL
jgi:hypothetical protein